MSQRDLVADELWPALVAEADRLEAVERWWREEHEPPHQPAQATAEYRELADRAPTPWGALIVTTVAQELYVDSYRRADDDEVPGPWAAWESNGLMARQTAVHRAALGYGYAWVRVTDGRGPAGPMPVIRGVSPRRAIGFYRDEVEDDWPELVLEARPGPDGTWDATVWDAERLTRYLISPGGKPTYLTWEPHGAGVCPWVRFVQQPDLDGRAVGEIEPFVPLFARIDQTIFDRLVVQRFASWVVRTIAGMTPPADGDVAAEKLRLRVEDILVAEDPDTKFGSLPATDLRPFIDAAEADVQTLAAVSQTPAHELLGKMANLSAEALAAARNALNRKVEERKAALGMSWAQTLRLAAAYMGDRDAAADMSAQVRWRDMETRSLSQAADALGKLATMLEVPVELLWERIPGWTDVDVRRAKSVGADRLFAAEIDRILSDEPDDAAAPAAGPAAG